MSIIPSSEEARNDLSQLIPVIYQALEAGIQDTREFFDRLHKPIDASLAPDLVRYFVKEFLDYKGQNAEYEREQLSNNGLCLNYGKYLLRIRKTGDGELPVPGRSEPLQNFYKQKQLLLDISVSHGQVNLMILWEASSAYNLTGIFLSCPKAGDTSRASVEDYWTIRIPHPALSLTSSVADPAHVDEIDDLPISKPADTKAEQAE